MGVEHEHIQVQGLAQRLQTFHQQVQVQPFAQHPSDLLELDTAGHEEQLPASAPAEAGCDVVGGLRDGTAPPQKVVQRPPGVARVQAEQGVDARRLNVDVDD